MCDLNYGFKIDFEEFLNILTSIIAISLSITIANFGFSLSGAQFLKFFGIFSVTVGSGFLFHELAHKFVAIKFGHYARFISWQFGLILMLVLSFLIAIFNLPLPLFLAPGAVVIFSNKKISLFENGIISAAGPITNILLALVFFILFVLFSVQQDLDNPIFLLFFIGVKINLFLAFFNLLPLYPLDGSKIFSWNKFVWFILFLISLIGFLI